MIYSENDMEREREAAAEMFCPECSSHHIEQKHAEPSFAYPETDYKECYECGAQWGHE